MPYYTIPYHSIVYYVYLSRVGNGGFCSAVWSLGVCEIPSRKQRNASNEFDCRRRRSIARLVTSWAPASDTEYMHILVCLHTYIHMYTYIYMYIF